MCIRDRPVESYGAKESLPLGGKRVISTPRHYAYLKIAEGCNHRCHYCAIPLIRGPLRSRTTVSYTHLDVYKRQSIDDAPDVAKPAAKAEAPAPAAPAKRASIDIRCV